MTPLLSNLLLARSLHNCMVAFCKAGIVSVVATLLTMAAEGHEPVSATTLEQEPQQKDHIVVDEQVDFSFPRHDVTIGSDATNAKRPHHFRPWGQAPARCLPSLKNAGVNNCMCIRSSSNYQWTWLVPDFKGEQAVFCMRSCPSYYGIYARTYDFRHAHDYQWHAQPYQPRVISSWSAQRNRACEK